MCCERQTQVLFAQFSTLLGCLFYIGGFHYIHSSVCVYVNPNEVQ